jgi:probable rRNA maturation factor
MMLQIVVDADEEWDSSGSLQTLLRRAAEAAVAESAFPQLAAAERPVEISVALGTDDQVRALNAEWRGKDRPTNVLSFPMMSNAELNQVNVAGPELLLGDIVLAHDVCEAEARDKGISLEQHAAHLLVHGMLHLLGYGHDDDDEAEDMEAREVRALARLGIANPYEVTA